MHEGIEEFAAFGNGSHGMGCMNEVYELGQHNVVDDQPGMKCFETHLPYVGM